MMSERKMQLPVGLKIGRKRYPVKLVRWLPGARRGLFVRLPRAEVRVAMSAQDGHYRYTPRMKHETFCHELTHAILEHMGHELWRNERFVSAFSRRLSQAMLSFEYRADTRRRLGG